MLLKGEIISPSASVTLSRNLYISQNSVYFQPLSCVAHNYRAGIQIHSICFA